ncbi:MAG: hypothetical protein ACRDN6_11585, partial [Gaiellaceae bacterium]
MTSRTNLGVLAIVVLALGYATFAQGIGWNQNAHFALVRALADGTAVVDPYRDESGDVAWVDGHYYSTKAPGLAFATLPAYVALDRLGLLGRLASVPGATDASVGTLWALGLVGVVLPAGLLLLLVRRLAGELEPGLGTATALIAGLGTLLLPFATLFFAHALSAFLGFAAFALVWRERRRSGPVRAGRLAAAGLVAGLAITTEYPLALVAVGVGAYALARGEILRRGLTYGAGLAAGLVPLLLYNAWAFGSPFHLSYENAVLVGGASGHDVLGANDAGFFGVGAPSLSTAGELLFSRIGLLTLAPVLCLGVGGIVLLYRRGLRAEALLTGGLAAAYLVYSSGYHDPFGGFSPGPRFLVPVLPFLVLAVAPVLRRLPATTLALAAVSALLMIGVTVSGPLLAFDGRFHERIAEGWFNGRSWLTIVPFLVLATLSAVLAARATSGLSLARREA